MKKRKQMVSKRESEFIPIATLPEWQHLSVDFEKSE